MHQEKFFIGQGVVINTFGISIENLLIHFAVKTNLIGPQIIAYIICNPHFQNFRLFVWLCRLFKVQILIGIMQQHSNHIQLLGAAITDIENRLLRQRSYVRRNRFIFNRPGSASLVDFLPHHLVQLRHQGLLGNTHYFRAFPDIQGSDNTVRNQADGLYNFVDQPCLFNRIVVGFIEQQPGFECDKIAGIGRNKCFNIG
jgi:hypothetical protein